MPPIDLLLGLVVFAAVTCFTPGPNNTMLMASGLNFGMRRTLPHVLGVTLGFSFMVLAVGLGIGQLLAASPLVYTALKTVAVLYLLWLAWGIATSGGVPDGETGARPLSFLEACAFQWINPKGWIMAVGASTSYAMAGSLIASAAVAASVFAVVGLASSTSWAVFGAAFRRLLTRPELLRVVNLLLAALLILSLYPVLSELAMFVARD
jgi:threonine/homoserine/homoserine lactone efflux protein